MVNKNYLFIASFIGLLLFMGSCINDPINQKTLPLPSKPSDVAKTWLAHMDLNEFNDAKVLSSDHTLKFIEYLENTFTLEDPNFKHEVIKINKIDCKVAQDSCTCYFEDEFEIQDSIQLVKRDTQWLVHIPEELIDAFAPNAEEFKAAFDKKNNELTQDSTAF